VQDPDWSIDRRGGPWRVTARLLARARGVAHAFSTRRDGASTDFDLGSAREPSPAALERRRALCRAAGFGDREPTVLEQVHGARAVTPREPGGEGTIGVGDALYAVCGTGASPILAVRTADCAAIVLAAEDGRAIAAIHAGWRGAAAGIVAETVRALAGAGIEPGGLLAAIGPTIGPCCYAVGRDVVDAVAAGTRVPEDRLRGLTRAGRESLDLPASLDLQLRAAGLPPASIRRAPWCTSCHPDLFFSYRRDGRVAGRMMAVVGWSRPVP
jgi:hypothetical protein